MSRISKTKIILIGFMASGKSVVAKKLAKKLKMPVIDTDTLIENEQEMKIKDIFRVHGELFFRKLEKEILKKILSLKRFKAIISTGGGIVLNPENRRILRKCGIVFYLKSSPEVVLNRVSKDKIDERPLLAGKTNTKDEIKRLLKVRERYYRACAHYTIDTSGMKIREVVNKITGILKKSPVLLEKKC